MSIAKMVKVLVVLVGGAVYCYWAVDSERGRVHNVSVELDKPMSIVWPVEIAIVGDMGEKGLRIAPHVGQGWRGQAGGEAAYKFYIPQQGKYHVWVYCLWFDECANAIFARIDQSDKAILGNDPVYKQWHWVRGFDIELDKGTHNMVLSNHSDHIAVQKIFFTNSANVTPTSSGVVFADIFYDGFDGCDRGNFADWKVVSGQWSVMNPSTQACYIENALVGTSTTDSFIVYENDGWSNYSVDVAAKIESAKTSGGSAAVCFGVKDETEYHQLSWKLNESLDSAIMQMAEVTSGRPRLLKEFEVPWEVGKWHQIEVSLNVRKVVVIIDNQKPVETSVEHPITGGIGLHLHGLVKAYFDDIHVRKSTINYD